MSTYEDDSSSEASSTEEESWISWFCNLNGNHFFCEVERAYVEDSFNLFGLKQYVTKDFSNVLDTILDRLDPNEIETDDLSRSAALLYGLIHARYIITANGLEAMHQKFLQKEFGECPRLYCKNQAVLPVGLYDEPKQGSLKLFCPNCYDIYNCHVNNRNIDGAYFGTTFAHLLLMDLAASPTKEKSSNSNEKNNKYSVSTSNTHQKYTPKIFGFKIHQSSPYFSKVRFSEGSRNNATSILSHIDSYNSYYNNVNESVAIPQSSLNQIPNIQKCDQVRSEIVAEAVEELDYSFVKESQQNSNHIQQSQRNKSMQIIPNNNEVIQDSLDVNCNGIDLDDDNIVSSKVAASSTPINSRWEKILENQLSRIHEMDDEDKHQIKESIGSIDLLIANILDNPEFEELIVNILLKNRNKYNRMSEILYQNEALGSDTIHYPHQITNTSHMDTKSIISKKSLTRNSSRVVMHDETELEANIDFKIESSNNIDSIQPPIKKSKH